MFIPKIPKVDFHSTHGNANGMPVYREKKGYCPIYEFIFEPVESMRHPGFPIYGVYRYRPYSPMVLASETQSEKAVAS